MSAALIAAGMGVAIADVAIVFALIAFAPAHAALDIDTSKGLAELRVCPLWGLGAEIQFRRDPALKTGGVAKLLQRLRDTPRLAHAALAAPRLIAPARRLMVEINALKPSANRLTISVNAIHPLANAIIDFGGGLPDGVRTGVEIRARKGFGIDLAAQLRVYASPFKLWRIYGRVRADPGVIEFLRRLKGER